MTRRRLPAWRCAVVCVAAVVIAGSCSGSAAKRSTPPSTTAPATRTDHATAVTVRAVALAPGAPLRGTVSRVEITMASSATLDVAISGDAASRAQWTATAWDAVIAATLRAGTPCAGHRFTFRVAGPVDGTSAGALLTVAVLALLRGDPVRPDVSVAGTIGPDGGVGPVDDVPARVAAAGAAGITTVFVPAGERPTAAIAGVDVREAADLTDAYRSLTGRTMPVLADAPPGLPAAANAGPLLAAAHAHTAQVATDLRAVSGLPAVLRDGLAPLVAQARDESARATALERAGANAGAFQSAREASTVSGAAARAGALVASALASGVDAFSERMHHEQDTIRSKTAARLASLDAARPRTIVDVSALLGAYGAATDSSGLAADGAAQLASLQALPASTPRPQVVQRALGAAFFVELASGLLGYSADILTVGRSAAGATVRAPQDLGPMSACFGAAAAANLAAFDAVVVEPMARAASTTATGARAALAAQDLDYVLATSAAPRDGSPYAQLGINVARFVRSVKLLDEYAGFHARRDTAGAVTSVADRAALQRGLDHGAAQARRVLSALDAAHTAPPVEIGAAELANVDREQTLDDQMTALGAYWSVFVTGRLLARLGGI